MTGENTISLVGATIHEVDGKTCTITLTELQRSLAIAISGTSGGDGGAAILDVYADGVRDHGENTNLNNFVLLITETPDTVLPVLELGLVNYGTGLVTIRSSETIDVTPHEMLILVKFMSPMVPVITMFHLRIPQVYLLI